MDLEGRGHPPHHPGHVRHRRVRPRPRPRARDHEAYHRYIGRVLRRRPETAQGDRPVSGAAPEEAAKTIDAQSGRPDGWRPSPPYCPRACPSTTRAWSRSGRRWTPTTCRCSTTRSSTSPRTSRVIATSGATSSSPAPPPTRGAPNDYRATSCSAACSIVPAAPDGFAECSAGWLPAWLVRLRGQAEYMRHACPRSVDEPLDYAASGHVFCGIELYEGEKSRSRSSRRRRRVILYQSDYPHNGWEFPSSPDIALSWTGIGETAMHKLMYDNAARYLRLV